MNRLPPPWILVLFGLVLNVLAILMSSVVLERLGNDINVLSEKKGEHVYAIQLAWNRVETLERKRETLIVHLGQSDAADTTLSSALQLQLNDWLNVPAPQIEKQNLHQLMMLIDQAQQQLREKIDDFYLENLQITENIAQLEGRIAWYKSIALFLQIFGLALILARDLAHQ